MAGSGQATYGACPVVGEGTPEEGTDSMHSSAGEADW